MTLTRNPAVTVTELEGEFFLVEPDSGEIYYLDTIASGLWRAAEQGSTLEELTALMIAAFPETPWETIRADVERVVQEMVAGSLLISAPGTRPAPSAEAGR
ncbi:MAG: PqqD family protein [Rhodovibrionaceae bacterium]